MLVTLAAAEVSGAIEHDFVPNSQDAALANVSLPASRADTDGGRYAFGWHRLGPHRILAPLGPNRLLAGAPSTVFIPL